MSIKTIDSQFSVSGPLSAEDYAVLNKKGVRTLINTRPDNEEAGQTPDAQWCAQAAEHGLAYHFLPVVSGKYSLQQVEAFGELLATSKAPVHGFCRTGTRVLHLWLLLQQQRGADPATLSSLAHQFNTQMPQLLTSH